MQNKKQILDACCGGKMFYFDKQNPDVLFCDIREETMELCDGRQFCVKPDMIVDFRSMPFEDDSFNLVVFDPPHLNNIGQNSWLAKKYGRLPKDGWKDYILKGFNECMRVLKPGGTLLFKWNERQIKSSELLNTLPQKPLLETTMRGDNTHFYVFYKNNTY